MAHARLIPLKGVGNSPDGWRVSVAYKGKIHRHKLNFKNFKTADACLRAANALSRELHKKLGKPLKIYVQRIARSNSGHIGIYIVRSGWMVQVRGQGHPAYRIFVPKREGIRHAILLRKAIVASIDKRMPPPPMISRNKPK